MGYTHYSEENKTAPVTQDEWSRIESSFVRLKDAIDKAGAEGRIDFSIQADHDDYDRMDGPAPDICFDAVDADGEQASCETFLLLGPRASETPDPYRDSGFYDFCKTEQLPYDVMVVAVLIVAEHEAPGAWDIYSDGDAKDWTPGLEFVRKTLQGPKDRPYQLPAGVIDAGGRGEAVRRRNNRIR